MTNDLGGTLKREYEGGATIADLAHQHGLTYYRTRTLLLATGVTLRQEGPRTPTAPLGMVNAYEGGATIHEVAATFGCSYGVTRRMLLAANVTLRPKGQRL
ncbi:helix-turn-helix domain-containing protein [Amycolatopsis thailandensis]|uniref:helix-turn-helix domain-containing protein n=1 Tax=Amycolatopsis thailandensis TaxID=589330 RepID=UPI0037BCEF83